MNTSEVQSLAIKKVLNFDGVFPVNNLPITAKKEYRLIINTDTDNLPGVHWIAIIVRKDNTAYVFDPLGHPPSLFIQNWLRMRNVQWSCNLRQVQPNDSTLCGLYCIFYLHFIDYNPLKYELFECVTNLLFPKHVPLSIHESTVYEVLKECNDDDD